MKRIFLASSIDESAKAIAEEIRKESPKAKKLLFIDTAAETKGEKSDLSWLQDDRKGLVDAGFEVSDFTITGKTVREIAKAIENNDIIHFNGGNSFYLLKQLQLTNYMDLFRKAVDEGKIYTGSSAGSIIAAPDIYATRYLDKIKDAGGELPDYRGLGIVNFLVFPHWGSEHFKEKYLKEEIINSYEGNDKIILLRDSQYISVKDDLFRIVSV